MFGALSDVLNMKHCPETSTKMLHRIVAQRNCAVGWCAVKHSTDKEQMVKGTWLRLGTVTSNDRTAGDKLQRKKRRC